jgi:pyruvate/2-oxoglutarate dehydrogenase complex dihydrolipoamide acyltransferase (E2) component
MPEGDIEEVVLPQWGMGMLDGEIAEWLVEIGDFVHEGDELVEVEAAKVTDVVYAPFPGVVRRLCAEEGATVQVREPLVLIERKESEG